MFDLGMAASVVGAIFAMPKGKRSSVLSGLIKARLPKKTGVLCKAQRPKKSAQFSQNWPCIKFRPLALVSPLKIPLGCNLR